MVPAPLAKTDSLIKITLKTFSWCIRCYNFASGHISHDIDQENGPTSGSPSLDRPQTPKFRSYLSEVGLFGPQIDFLEPQNVFFCCLKCFKSASVHISQDIDQKNV